MFRGAMIGAAVVIATSGASVSAATRIVVLHPDPYTDTSVLIAGFDANPVRLLSFEVTPSESGRVELDGMGVFFAVTANQQYTFSPNTPINSNGYGQYYGRLRLLNQGNVLAAATWRNITLELGDQVVPAPEPATWAMMIAGFGLAGAAARIRTRKPIAA